MSLECTLYRNGSADKVVDKSLTTVGSYSIVIKDQTSVVRPVITLETGGFPDANYAYIPYFQRYYYITDIQSVRTGVYELRLKSDVLMSHKSGIRASEALVARQENEYNMYLNDGIFKSYQNPLIQLKSFPSGLSGQSYVLLVSGAYQQEEG